MVDCNRICEWNNPSSGCMKPETVECKMPNLFKGAKPQTNAEVVREWIPVTERLPDETRDEYVLVVCDYYGKVTVETRKMWHIDACVTHWMPLPEPPMRKGENDG